LAQASELNAIAEAGQLTDQLTKQLDEVQLHCFCFSVASHQDDGACVGAGVCLLAGHWCRRC
jgi:hypothetical protein